MPKKFIVIKPKVEKYLCTSCKRDFTDEVDDRSSFEEIGKIICMDCFDKQGLCDDAIESEMELMEDTLIYRKNIKTTEHKEKVKNIPHFKWNEYYFYDKNHKTEKTTAEEIEMAVRPEILEFEELLNSHGCHLTYDYEEAKSFPNVEWNGMYVYITADV